MSVLLHLTYTTLNPPTTEIEASYNKQYIELLNGYICEYFNRHEIPAFPIPYELFFHHKDKIHTLSLELPTIAFMFFLPSLSWLVVHNGRKKYYYTHTDALSDILDKN